MSIPDKRPSTSSKVIRGAFSSEAAGTRDEIAADNSQSILDQLADRLDKGVSHPHHENMNAPTREEIDAKLQLIDERMDGRVRRIEDLVASAIDSMKETRSAVGSLKTTVITTGIGSVLAIVLGVAAFNATVLSNMLAAFESGKNTSASQAAITATQADIKKQSEETAALLRQLQQQAASPPSPVAPK